MPTCLSQSRTERKASTELSLGGTSLSPEAGFLPHWPVWMALMSAKTFKHIEVSPDVLKCRFAVTDP